MIVITGAAGFIGSVTMKKLNELGVTNLLVVDHLGMTDKWRNLSTSRFADYMEKGDFLAWFRDSGNKVEAVIHLGACSSTTETDASYLIANNFEYTKRIWHCCVERRIPLLYASSAATYGDGVQGYADESELCAFQPMNAYGYSKHLTDLWTSRQHDCPPMWAGMKFFNVYGPNEYHKGSMASVVLHAYRQIKASGRVALFKSYRADVPNGCQERDFVYVKDVAKVIAFLLGHSSFQGIINIGSGRARTFEDLAKAVFAAMGRSPYIDYIEMPDGLRDRYQYRTEANISKLRRIGYTEKMSSLESSVADYVRNYLERSEARL